MENTAAFSLYNLLVTRDFDPELLSTSGRPVTDPAEAELFSFDWKTSNKNYGTVVILLGREQDLEVYYGDNLGRNMESDDKSEWFDFLAQIKNFATRNLLTFNLNNLNRLKYTMQGLAAIKEGLFEGFHGNRRTSYSAGPRQTRLMIQHSRDLREGEPRHHAIENLFIETASGERFRVPSRSLTHGRILERHVAEGGTPYDQFGTHINDMMNEMSTISRFMRAMRGRELVGNAARLANEAVKHYQDLKVKAKRMVSQRGYREELEKFDPAHIQDHETTVENIKELFVERSLDQRVESALPIMARLEAKRTTAEAQEFEEWALALTEQVLDSPTTPEQEAILKQMMQYPLPVGPDAINATEQLYDVFGDRALFDRLIRLAQQDADADARPLIQQRLSELGIELDDSGGPEVEEDLDVDGVMMTRASNMSSESLDRELARLRQLLTS